MTQYMKRFALILALVVGAALPMAALAQETEPTAVTAEGEAPVNDVEGEGSAENEASQDGPAEGEGETAEAAEAQAATSPLVPLGINTGFLIFQIFNFLLIFGLLTFLVWRPLMNTLDSRAARIAKGLEDASAAANARRNAEAEAETIRSQARAETARTVEEARTRGEEIGRAVQVEARTEADRIREEARARAAEETNRQLADLRGQVIQIAVAMSQRIIGETLDQQRQQALVNDFFAQVPADARSLRGNLEVVSAMPLTPDEQTRVRGEVGGDSVNFTVDPSILGGLIIRSQDQVVDASVRTNLNDLAGRLR